MGVFQLFIILKISAVDTFDFDVCSRKMYTQHDERSLARPLDKASLKLKTRLKLHHRLSVIFLSPPKTSLIVKSLNIKRTEIRKIMSFWRGCQPAPRQKMLLESLTET